MLKLYLRIRHWLEVDQGQNLAEYSLLIGLMALALVGAIAYLAAGVDATFRGIADVLSR